MIKTVYGVAIPKEILNMREYVNNEKQNEVIEELQIKADKYDNMLITTRGNKAVFIFKTSDQAEAFAQDIKNIVSTTDINTYNIEFAEEA